MQAIDVLSGASSSTETLQLFTGRAGYALRFRPRGSPQIPIAPGCGPVGPGAGHPDRGPARPSAGVLRHDESGHAPGIAPNHIYAVLGYDPARDVVHVWNPWGNQCQFTPAGPPGLEAGYPVQDGHFSGRAKRLHPNLRGHDL